MGRSWGRVGRLVGTTAVVLAALAVAAAPASAVNRFASSSGTTVAGPCTDSTPPPSAAPCTIGTALNAAQTGDDVTLLGTTYPTQASQLTVFEGITVHGTPGAPVTIPSTAATAIVLESGAALRDVEVVHTGDGQTLYASAGPVTLDRVAARMDSVASTGTACYLLNSSALIRNSVCWSADPNGTALWVDATTGASQTVTLRNVTAVDTADSGAGILAFTRFAPGTNLTVRATNVIAQGEPDGDWDVYADNDGTGVSSVVLDYSNYNEASSNPTGSSVTPVGTGTNVTTPPVFVNSGAGDFTQQATSTGTIDRGTGAVVNGFGPGPFALSGEPRCMGAAPDIGADELAGSACPVPTAGTAAVAETGLRAAALAECRRKAKKNDWSKKRRKRCRRNAEELPL